jgi:2-succinyl-6-hydroxy-2,4-cyclohexadiene-1-carboxylate synthase
VIAIDLPGHGESSSPADPHRYSLDRFADDLARVLDDLDIEQATMLGYSMGGRAALRFAMQHPERLSALILESTSSGIANEKSRMERMAADAVLANMLEREGVAAFVARWEKLPMWSSQSSLADAGRAELRAQRLSNNATGLSNSLRGAGAGVDAPDLERLKQITTRTLLLAGELDAPYVEHARQLASAIPRSLLRTIPGAGHAIHLEQPDPMLAEVTEFLRAG